MRKITLLVLTISGLTTASFGKKFNSQHPELKALWGKWKNNHTKSYSEHEEAARMKVFMDNHNMIEEYNANPNNTATLAINQYADLTEDEFAAKYLRNEPDSDYEHEIMEEEEEVDEEEENRILASLPKSVDWRSKGAVSSVKSQGHCGGCWSFAVIGALESLHYIKTGKMQDFSEQHLINCDTKSHGCSSGHTDTAFAYAASKGVVTESSNPFKGVTQKCNFIASKATKVSSGYVSVQKNMPALLAAIVKQPVSIDLAGGVNAFRFYKSGVITSCPSATTHSVLAVGYTTVNGVQALIVKNSWGTGWGQKGYVYISTASANSGKGVCGVLNKPRHPTA